MIPVFFLQMLPTNYRDHERDAIMSVTMEVRG